MRDPFRRGLGQAVQWYGILQVELEMQVNDIIHCCRLLSKQTSEDTSQLDPSPSLSLAHAHHGLPSRNTCAEILIQCCPACFGGTLFGRSLDQGGDIHVATDGNFHHRHWQSAGDSPSFYEPFYFLPKAQVDAVGRHIDRARRHPSKGSQSEVPDEAIDQCEASYEAADGQKQKASTDTFDDTRLMALICRHDIPLFLANIDMPGEQQKYSIVLIEHLFTLLPSQANVIVLYDVGCVLARLLSQVHLTINSF